MSTPEDTVEEVTSEDVPDEEETSEETESEDTPDEEETSEETESEDTPDEAVPEEKDDGPSDPFLGPMMAMAALMVVSQLIALAVLPLYASQGIQAVEDPSDPNNILVFLVFILLFTGLILLLAKYGKERFISYIILGTVVYSASFVLYPVFAEAGMLVNPAIGLSLAIGVLLVVALVKHPEWYVIDSTGVLLSAGLIAIFGRSFELSIAIGFLAVLAIYDAISVYKTKHMVDLADAVLDQQLPILFVIPRRKGYSFKDEGQDKDHKGGRGALFMGLGDAIIPGMLAASAATFLSPEGTVSMSALGVGLITILGIIGGYLALMIFVSKGKPQAGLPLLNTGAIVGYLVGYLLIFQDWSFGIF